MCISDEGKLGPPRLRTYRNLNVNNRRKLSTTIESKREERRKEETEARKTKRFDRISVYRRYRVGELPDVQISYAALLTPLLALCQVIFNENELHESLSLFQRIGEGVLLVMKRYQLTSFRLNYVEFVSIFRTSFLFFFGKKLL